MTLRILAALFILCLSYIPASYAQMDGFFGQPPSEEGEEPPLQMPAVPDAPVQQVAPQMPSEGANVGVQAYFPALPPSRLCKPRDLIGLWKLSTVYENPTGAELADFSASPFQYIAFGPDSTFAVYKGSRAESSDLDVYKKMAANKGGVLQQYVMHESGVVYFYKDGIAFDSFACFIVANKLSPFYVGQLLLMPPPDKATVQMVRVYQKINFNKPKAKNKRGNRGR